MIFVINTITQWVIMVKCMRKLFYFSLTSGPLFFLLIPMTYSINLCTICTFSPLKQLLKLRGVFYVGSFFQYMSELIESV